MTKIILYFKKELFLLSVFILIISFSQTIILKPHLEFGFSPDDIRSFADFSAQGPNPLSKFFQLYQQMGPHSANPIYYNGILYTFFGFNYQAYQVTALIFKILSIISFFLLIQIVFRNRLLSFISGLIFSFHYGSVGSMEMVARTQDYLVITGLNIFLILFYSIFFGGFRNILWTILSSIVLFSAFFINPIRAYPILPFICLLAVLIFFKKRSLSNFYRITKQLLIIFSPFMLFFGLQGTGGVFYGNALEIIKRIAIGNFQMLLNPFSSFGSLFLTGNILRPLSSPIWTLNTFLSYFLGGPFIVFGITTLILSFLVSDKPLKFLLGVFITNFFLDLLIFFTIDHAMNLPPSFKMSYDPYTFATPAILGVYIIVLTIFIFLERIQKKQNIYLSLYLLGISFAVTFVWFTWILYDYVHIPMGIYGYSTIPSMGISAAIAGVFMLAYTRIKNYKIPRTESPMYYLKFYKSSRKLFLRLLLIFSRKTIVATRLAESAKQAFISFATAGGFLHYDYKSFLRFFSFSVFLPLVLYFFFSNNQIQPYLKANMDYGNKASDQTFLKNKFWNFLKDDTTACNNFFYFETTLNEQKGLNYSFIMIDRFDRWYSLYSPHQSKKPCPVALLVSNEEKLFSSYTSIEGKEGFLYKYFNGGDNFFSLEDFYAFRLKNRDIIDIKPEILKKLKLSP